MSHPARALVLAVALAMLSAAPAQAGTIVFDFEDGLQGWELHGATQRVQTQLLGGEWAIFGDGILDPASGIAIVEALFVGRLGAHMLMTQDLGPVRSLSIEQFAVGSADAGPLLFMGGGTLQELFTGTFREFVRAGRGNPSVWTIDISDLEGTAGLRIVWGRIPTVGRINDGEPPSEPPRLVGFVDNVTFHAIPEPSVLGMLVMGGVAALKRRARHGS